MRPPRRQLAPGLRPVHAVLALTLACPLVGCQTDGRTTRGFGGAVPEGTWPYWPVQARIHPVSRIAPGDGPERGTLDLRIEFFDADGIDGRAVGVLRVELAQRGRGSGASTRRDWTIDLVDPAVNRRTFDTITRTYHVRREVEWERPPAPGSTLDATITLEATNGDVLRARTTVRWD